MVTWGRALCKFWTHSSCYLCTMLWFTTCDALLYKIIIIHYGSLLGQKLGWLIRPLYEDLQSPNWIQSWNLVCWDLIACYEMSLGNMSCTWASWGRPNKLPPWSNLFLFYHNTAPPSVSSSLKFAKRSIAAALLWNKLQPVLGQISDPALNSPKPHLSTALSLQTENTTF